MSDYESSPVFNLFISVVLVIIGLFVSIWAFNGWAEDGFPGKWESPNSVFILFLFGGIGAIVFGLLGIWQKWKGSMGSE